MSVSLYIHIPFCKSKCRYCDFLSAPSGEETREGYISALESELRLYGESSLTIDTIYMGGGTPSLLSIAQFDRIACAVFKYFKTDIKEFTLECNPESVNKEKLCAYKARGVNRISLGVQSLNDKVLVTLGRAHDKADALVAMDMLGDSFTNWSADIMLGLPDERENDPVDCVKAAIERGAKHISAYSLMLEEGTPLNAAVAAGEITVPDSDAVTDSYERTLTYLKSCGFSRYEISNFAIEGFECAHNRGYWHLKEYIGTGLGAHGYLGRVRYENLVTFQEYGDKLAQGKLPVKESRAISQEETEEEFIMLAMRTREGMDLREYKLLFNSDFNSRYASVLYRMERFLLISINRVSIKPEYLGVMNSMILEFID